MSDSTSGFDQRFAAGKMRELAKKVGASTEMERVGPEKPDARKRLAILLDDRERLKKDLRQSRRRVEQLNVQLRSALHELAAQQSLPSSVFIGNWLRRHSVGDDE